MSYGDKVIKQLIEFSEYEKSIMDTNLFRKIPSQNYYNLNETRLFYNPRMMEWYIQEEEEYTRDFEKILDLVDDEMQVKLLFHLDLFA